MSAACLRRHIDEARLHRRHVQISVAQAQNLLRRLETLERAIQRPRPKLHQENGRLQAKLPRDERRQCHD
jgi:hypothetical protein